MTHFVFDTNVMISALLFNDSVPGRAFYRAFKYGTILISQPLVEELSEVLCRGKFDRYISHEERDKFLAALITEATLIETTESVHVCRDPEDNQILELAVNGNAAYIVTGDIDLLVLNPFRGAQIVTPAEFLKREPDQKRRRRDDEHDE